MADFTVDQYRAAARRAYEGGDMKSAQELIAAGQALEALHAEMAPPKADYRGEGGGRGTSLEAGLIGARQAATFGFGDEINAGLRAFGDWLGGKPIGESYDKRLEHERGLLEQTREENPASSFAGELGGGIAAGLAAAPAMPIKAGAGLLSQAARMAGVGAAEGAAYGFGEGQGGLSQRADSAGTGAMVGGALGAAAPYALAGAKRVGNSIGGVLGTNNAGRAQDVVSGLVEGSGKTPQQLQMEMAQAAAEGQPEYRLVDALGRSGQNRLGAIARSPGEAQQPVIDFLNNRQMGQADRIGSAVSDAFGFGGQQAGSGAAAGVLAKPRVSREATVAAMREARGAAADTAYSAARQGAQSVDTSRAVAAIDDALGNLQGSGVTLDGSDKVLASARRLLAGKDGFSVSDFDTVLSIKSQLGDEIEALRRAGRGNAVRKLGKVYRELDGALEGSSGGYRAANDAFRADSGVIDAVDAGKDFLRPGRRATDTTAQFSGMVPEQQAAARLGYGDDILRRIGNQKPGINSADQLTTPKIQQEIGSMALDPAKLTRQIERENAMYATRGRATGGSPTMDMLAAQEANTSDMMGAAGNLLAGNIGTAVARVVQGVGRTVGNLSSGQNETVRRIVAEALLSDDPASVIRAAVQRQQVNVQTARAIMSAMTGGSTAAATGP